MSELNRNYKERDKIIFGEYDPEKYSGGIRRFQCSPEVIEELLYKNYIDPKECQNESPSVKEFMEYIDSFRDLDISFECYAVSPARSDYRVTIEGIDIVIPEEDYDNVSLCVENFRYADEFSFEHAWQSYYLHAWWD